MCLALDSIDTAGSSERSVGEREASESQKLSLQAANCWGTQAFLLPRPKHDCGFPKLVSFAAKAAQRDFGVTVVRPGQHAAWRVKDAFLLWWRVDAVKGCRNRQGK